MKIKDKKKILVFEYISGGGMISEKIPASLAKEGLLMLQNLINELAELSFTELIILQDWRIEDLKVPLNCQVVRILENQSIVEILNSLIQSVDYVWPIAPEIDYELEKITHWVEQKNIQLLNSSSAAVNICSDKWKTFQALHTNKIPCVETFQLDSFGSPIMGDWVIKPKDGAGCLNSFLVSSDVEIDKIVSNIADKSKYIIQPYIEGEVLSLSCLFRKGRAWLMCCNKQQMEISQGQFILTACAVNYTIDNNEYYQNLINQVAKTISGLWGYVGVDIILPSSGQPLILEINSRLTSSYVGIFEATGINVAATVVAMLNDDPEICKTKNVSTIVKI